MACSTCPRDARTRNLRHQEQNLSTNPLRNQEPNRFFWNERMAPKIPRVVVASCCSPCSLGGQLALLQNRFGLRSTDFSGSIGADVFELFGVVLQVRKHQPLVLIGFVWKQDIPNPLLYRHLLPYLNCRDRGIPRWGQASCSGFPPSKRLCKAKPRTTASTQVSPVRFPHVQNIHHAEPTSQSQYVLKRTIAAACLYIWDCTTPHPHSCPPPLP